MQRDPRAFLWDVSDAAISIQDFTKGMDVMHFRHSALVQAAVERKFEVIGEALNQLSRLDRDLAERIPDLAQIVAFRNQLIHGYAFVSQRRHGLVGDPCGLAWLAGCCAVAASRTRI